MRLLKIGADEATPLGQHWMGPEHTLLGILRGDSHDLARRALEQAGTSFEPEATSSSRISLQSRTQRSQMKSPGPATSLGRSVASALSGRIGLPSSSQKAHLAGSGNSRPTGSENMGRSTVTSLSYHRHAAGAHH